jgi:hypothetical protein
MSPGGLDIVVVARTGAIVNGAHRVTELADQPQSLIKR